MKQKTWLEEFNEAHSSVFEIPYQLEELAYSFDRVGNREISKELGTLASTLRDAHRTISGSVCRMLTEQNQKGVEQIATILSEVAK